MAFDSTLATMLTADEAKHADLSEPDRLANKLTQRARQSQSLANRAEAGSAGVVVPTADTITGNSEVEFATSWDLFTPSDDGTRGDLAVGTKISIRAFVTVTGDNAADTLNLRLRVGDDATAANNLSLVATGAKDAAADDAIYLTSEIVVGEVGASGALNHVSTANGANNFAGTNNAPVGLGFGVADFDTDALGIQPKLAVTGVWSSANAANIAQLESLEVSCTAPNSAITS